MSYPLVLDASHYQTVIDPTALIKAGAVGIILKATQLLAVTGKVDAYFYQNRDACRAAGLYVGAYGFLDPRGGVEQADLLLSVAGTETKLALDLESAGITIQEAEDFINEVYKATGEYCIIYTGAYVIRRMNASRSKLFAKCDLWIADHGNYPIVPPPWSNWKLWQYSYINISNKTYDANKFNGTLDDLKEWWRMSEQIVDSARVISGRGIPVYTGPGLDYPIQDFYAKDATIHIVHGSTKEDADNPGVMLVQTPLDMWVRVDDLQIADNQNPPPPPPPPPNAPVKRWTIDSLNLRESTTLDNEGKPNGKILVTIPSQQLVMVTPPASTLKYHFIPASYTSLRTGITYTGFCSNDWLTTQDPKA